jgi:hypothetical protein
MSIIKFGISYCAASAFEDATVGSKVIDSPAFFSYLEEALPNINRKYVPMLEESFKTTLGGVGKIPTLMSPEKSQVATHRKEKGLYLAREYACEVSGLGVIVYTYDEYANDAQGVPHDLAKMEGCTHVIVAVLAAAGPEPPVSPKRFLANIAGGNKDFMGLTYAEYAEMAEEVLDYAECYMPVAEGYIPTYSEYSALSIEANQAKVAVKQLRLSILSYMDGRTELEHVIQAYLS